MFQDVNVCGYYYQYFNEDYPEASDEFGEEAYMAVCNEMMMYECTAGNADDCS